MRGLQSRKLQGGLYPLFPKGPLLSGPAVGEGGAWKTGAHLETPRSSQPFARGCPDWHFAYSCSLPGSAVRLPGAQASWMQNIEKDQGAFDETVLEVLGLEAAGYGEA